MVNYSDPATIAKDSEAVVKLWHLTNGVYIWEFFTTFYYEWDVIRGHRPYRWTIWVYSLARVTTLLSIILNMVGSDSTGKINCQVWVSFLAIFSSAAFISATLLIVLRVIAIWNKAKIIFAIAMVIWLTETSLYLLATIRLRSSWSPEANACIMTNFDSTKYSSISSFSSDLALLIIMLIGLLRLRCEGGGAFALGRTLWKQGLIWILLATIAELPPVVFFILNLNVPLVIITQSPGMVIVTISATRLYRSLTNIYSSNIRSDSHENPRGTGRSAPDTRVQPGPIPLNRMEVSVRTEYDKFSSSQIDRPGAYINTDSDGHYKAHEVSLNGDVESGLEEK